MEMERWAGFGSALASLMFLYSVFSKYFPFSLESYFKKYSHRIKSLVYPYIQIKIPEYDGDRFKRSEAYVAIESYLSESCSQHASKLKADFVKDSDKLVLSMDDHEEVTDEFEGVKLWWASSSTTSRAPSNPFSQAPEERRSYRLTFHKSHRNQVIASYLQHVMAQGREVRIRNRQRKLFTNNASGGSSYSFRKTSWNHVIFDHPSTFATLAMHPDKKKEILDDLDTFRNSKDYYNKIGKAWKRGYLLYGPPGTGKSSMVAAIANYMDYDIYDLELTTVKTNTDLRKLLIETTSKSIILIEDIDCSLELTGKRKKKTDKESEEGKPAVPSEDDKDDGSSKVTLSGLLNFIDGLWSASAGERLIVFTTNHKEKLDPALIRRGRMDQHIEMSHCSFEAFQVLAKNYLGIDSHGMFDRVRGLMEEVKITPADVAENLMPKAVSDDAETCLNRLIQALGEAKEAALRGAESKQEEINGEESKTDGDDDNKELKGAENSTTCV